MSTESDPWDDIETLLDWLRVDEEVLLAVMEALGELDDSDEDEFAWDDPALGDFPLNEHRWGDPPMNVLGN